VSKSDPEVLQRLLEVYYKCVIEAVARTSQECYRGIRMMLMIKANKQNTHNANRLRSRNERKQAI
jgi:ribosomal protein S13